MTAVASPKGDEREIRAIVFKEGDIYVGQCLEYDIAAQDADIEDLLDKLELAVEAEFATCETHGKEPKECISPAPNYYHTLWDRSTVRVGRVNVPTPHAKITYALAKAA